MKSELKFHQKPLAQSRKNRRRMGWFALLGACVVVAMVVFRENPLDPPPGQEALEVRIIGDDAAPAAAVVKSEPLPDTAPVSPPKVMPEEKETPDHSPETIPPVAETRDDKPADAADGFAGEPPLLLTGLDATRDAAAKRDHDLLAKRYEILLRRAKRSAL